MTAPSPASLSAKRVLGFWTLLALGVNGVVGVGIFFVPAQLGALVPGAASALPFLLTALLLLPVAWTYGRLGSAFPEDGGPYVWARQALGAGPAYGVGVVAYASAVLSTAAVVSGLGEYLAPVLGLSSPPARFGFQVTAALAFCSIALLGLRPSAWVWSALTVAKLIPLLLLVGLGGAKLLHEPSPPPSGPISLEALGRAALIAVFPLQGFEIVPVPAGEVRGGRRTVLSATLLSLLGAATLYVLLQLACVRALPMLGSSRAPIVEAGVRYGGATLAPLFAAGTNLSTVGIAFGMFAMTPRYLAALGTDEALGRALSRERRGVPVLALLITTLAVLALVAAAGLGDLFVLSSLAVLLQYAVSAVALFLLARRRERGLSPLDQWLAPLSLLAITALAGAAVLLEIAALGAVVASGFGALWLRRRLASRLGAR